MDPLTGVARDVPPTCLTRLAPAGPTRAEPMPEHAMREISFKAANGPDGATRSRVLVSPPGTL